MIRDGSTIAISLRPRSTLTPTLVRARIPTIRLTPRTLASCACALTGAVDLTSVAGSTDEGRCATTSAQKASKRFGHRRSSNNQRAHRHTSTSVLCLQHARTRWVGRGTASVWLATFKPMSCLFSPVVAGALQRPRAATLRPRPPTAVEAVNLRIHRSHSTAAAINKIRKVRKTTRRHRLGQTSCAYHSPPEMHPFTPPSTIFSAELDPEATETRARQSFQLDQHDDLGIEMATLEETRRGSAACPPAPNSRGNRRTSTSTRGL